MATLQTIPNSSTVNVRELLLKYARQWPWFVLSLVLCIGLTALYFFHKTPVYEVSSTLMIRNGEEGSTGSLAQAEIMEMMGMGGNRAAKDEIEIYASRTAMGEALQALQLQTEYRKKQGLRWVGQYPDYDLVVRYPQQFCDTMRFKTTIDLKYRGNSWRIKVKYGKHVKSSHSVLSLSEPVMTCIGELDFTELRPLQKGDRIRIKTLPMPVLADQYKANIVVKQAAQESNILRISTRTDMPKRAQAFINKLTELYNFDAVVDKNAMASNTKAFIDDRLEVVTAELDSVEKAVEKYKQAQKLVSLSDEAKLYLETASEYQKALVSNQTQLNLVNYIQDFVSNKQNEHSLIPANLGVTDEALVTLIGSYNDLILKQMRLQRSAGGTNPALAQMDAQLTSLRGNILQSIQSVKDGLNITKTDLERQQAQFGGLIEDIPQQEKEFIAIQRQQQIKQTIYLFLYQKREENALTLASTVIPAKVIDKAEPSSDPVAPKLKLLLLIALVLGLCIPIVVILLLDVLDNKISDHKQFEKLIAPPFIGQLALSKQKQHIVVNSQDNSTDAELFRLLRGNLRFFLPKEQKCPVILVTSSLNGEGKSFVASNTAVSLSLLRKKVALVGLDIRKPVLRTYLNLPSAGCLTSYLAGEVDNVEDLVVPSHINDFLDVLPAGIVPPNPNELLQSERLDELFKTLKERYDYVIIDSAPVGMVSDTFLLSKFADMTLYVSRARYTTTDMIDFLNSLYEQKRLCNMACVLNGVAKVHAGYGYGYGYGYQQKR